MRADIFWRKFNSRRASTGEALVEVPEDADLITILKAAYPVTGVHMETRGSRGTGVYEVQTDKGVWQAEDGGALISYDTKRGTRVRRQTRFDTWEELEAQDRAEEMKAMKNLELRALEIEQPSGRKLYLTGVDVKQVHRYAAVSRVKRVAGKLEGYQRLEEKEHVETIRDYLESPGAMVPNAVVLAFGTVVTFRPDDGAPGPARPGVLIIPLMPEGTEEAELPGFIIDGQQRCAAGRDAAVESFTLPAVAFIEDDRKVQGDQFIRVNSVKPLKPSLITELLPLTSGALPPKLYRRRLPAIIMEALNQDEDSPLRGLIITCTNIRRTGKTPAKWAGRTGLVADNSILRALENSINDGVLYHLLELEESTRDEAVVAPGLALLKRWWGVVRDVFPDAWGKDPKDSRLFHGAGIVTMGLMLDGICALTKNNQPSAEVLRAELELVAGECRWTSGTWDLGPKPSDKRAWNELQNTPKDVARLANWLTATYTARRRALAQDGEPLPARPAVPSTSKKRAKGA